MKKNKIIICVVALLVLIIGIIVCLILFNKNDKESVILEAYTTLDYSKLIYRIENGKFLYSKFDNNYYLKNGKLDLKKALESKKISVEDLIKEMDFVDSLNDGSSKIYKSKDKKIVMYECHSLNGNNNYYITGNLYDNVCNLDKVKKLDTLCLDNKLGGMIADLENNVYKVDAKEITDGNIYGWDIYKNDKVGSYAIIRTNDNKVIEDFKKYYNDLTSNYKYVNIYEDWYVFIGNGFDDIDLRELNECVK